METAGNCPLDATEKPVHRRSKKATKPQLLNRATLDGRLNAAKEFDRLVSDIQSDMGGRDQLSAIEVALVEAFAGATVTLNDLNTRLLLGQPIVPSEHAQAVSAMVRVASRLGISRRAREVGPTLGELLRQDLDRQQLESAKQKAVVHG
ncbi:MAG TPA: hypothetical protein VIJ35_00365 [Bradyrhizobium sp.]